MIPSPLVCALLALAAFRCYRLASRDTFAPLVNFRSWLVGSYWLGGVQEFRRPTLAEWMSCAYCSGAYYATAWYGAWLVWPHGTMYGAVPFALSAAVGLLQAATRD